MPVKLLGHLKYSPIAVTNIIIGVRLCLSKKKNLLLLQSLSSGRSKPKFSSMFCVEKHVGYFRRVLKYVIKPGKRREMSCYVFMLYMKAIDSSYI